MYEGFFDLHERPFASAPDVRHYFPASAIQTARQTVTRCVARSEGAVLIVGPAGTGKSLLTQVAAEDFSTQLEVALIAGGHVSTARALLQAILCELGYNYRGLDEGELRLALANRATRQPSVSGILLVVDEAHLVPARVLEELRLITNLVRGGQSQVRLVLAGSTELEERFASPKLESFSQRLAARCYLEAFSREETSAYVRARIGACGGHVDRLFSAESLDRLHTATDGIPRLVNQLADHALVLALAAERRTVDAQIVKEAWADLQQLPTPWNESIRIARPLAADSDVIEFGTLDDEPLAKPAAIHPGELSPVEAAWLAADDATTDARSSFDEEFVPAGCIHPEVPFAFPALEQETTEPFYEDELVIDPYAALDAHNDLVSQRVTSREGRELWSHLAPFLQHDAAASLRVVSDSAPMAPLPVMSMPHHAPQTTAELQPTWRPAPLESHVEFADFAPENVVVSHYEEVAPAAAPIAVSAEDEMSDHDMIIIDDEAEELQRAHAPGFGRVRKQEYRQLFAKLRRG